MPHRNPLRAALILLGLGLAGSAHAGVSAAKPAHKPRAAHGAVTNGAAPHQSLDQIRSDLFHGSASQRDMERNDNDRVNHKPVDHTKDEFFSDWKGIQ